MYETIKQYHFLFEELVKRDFKKKYKRTILGMGWSILLPLLQLLVLSVIFRSFFGANTPHYTIYLFCGLFVYQFFAESTSTGMRALMDNAGIFSKINVPKYLFLLAKTTQVLLNFVLVLVVFLAFCLIDGIDFGWHFLILGYPIVTLLLFNLGVGFVLSALFVFFKDIDYLWAVALQLIMYGSAVFYRIDCLPDKLQMLFAFNPVYRHIAYIREVVIAGTIPGFVDHFMLFVIACISLAVGLSLYKRHNTEFLYYV